MSVACFELWLQLIGGHGWRQRGLLEAVAGVLCKGNREGDTSFSCQNRLAESRDQLKVGELGRVQDNLQPSPLGDCHSPRWGSGRLEKLLGDNGMLSGTSICPGGGGIHNSRTSEKGLG